MKTNEENLNTNKINITYKNDSGERNNGSGQPEQLFGESKFLWLMVSIFNVWSLILTAWFFCSKEGSENKDGKEFDRYKIWV